MTIDTLMNRETPLSYSPSVITWFEQCRQPRGRGVARADPPNRPLATGFTSGRHLVLLPVVSSNYWPDHREPDSDYKSSDMRLMNPTTPARRRRNVRLSTILPLVVPHWQCRLFRGTDRNTYSKGSSVVLVLTSTITSSPPRRQMRSISPRRAVKPPPTTS